MLVVYEKVPWGVRVGDEVFDGNVKSFDDKEVCGFVLPCLGEDVGVARFSKS